jgi:hypothetical protein
MASLTAMAEARRIDLGPLMAYATPQEDPEVPEPWQKQKQTDLSRQAFRAPQPSYHSAAAAARPKVSGKMLIGPERRRPVSRAAAGMDTADAEGYMDAGSVAKGDLVPMAASPAAVTAPQDAAAAQQAGAGAVVQNIGTLQSVSTASQPVVATAKASPRKFIGPERRPDVQAAATAAARGTLDATVTTSAAAPAAALVASADSQAAVPAAVPAATIVAAAAKSKTEAVDKDQEFFKLLATLPDTSAEEDTEPEGVAEAQQLPEPAMQATQAAGNPNTAAVSVASAAAVEPTWTQQQPTNPLSAGSLVNPSRSGYRVSGLRTEWMADRLVPQLAALATASRLYTKGRKLMQTANTRHLTATGTAAGSNIGSGRLPPCRMSDPFCFTDSECYCRLANGTYGASCPMYGTCLGGCCSTTGECPSRMGYEDPATGQQQVLLARTCSDWGLNEAGHLQNPWAAAAAAGGETPKDPLPSEAAAGLVQTSGLECKLPKGRSCDPSKGGAACMGYTVPLLQPKCEGSGCGGVQVQEGLSGAMCVYSKGDARRFDVCSCLPVY